MKSISDNSTAIKYGVNFQAQKAAEQVLHEFPMDRVALVTAFQVVHNKTLLRTGTSLMADTEMTFRNGQSTR